MSVLGLFNTVWEWCELLLNPFPDVAGYLGATLCRYNEVVSGVSLDLLRKGDDGHPILGGRIVTVHQVGVG